MNERINKLRIHTHPNMEERLNVPKDHVIIDKDVYVQILLKILSDPELKASVEKRLSHRWKML